MLTMLTSLKIALAKIIAVPLIAILTVAGYPIGNTTTIINQAPVVKTTTEKTLGAFNPTAAGTYRLQGGINTTASTLYLSSFAEPISGIAYTMSYLNSATEYGVIDSGTPNRSELISFTGITQNSDGTATITGLSRGLSRSYPYTASTTLAQTHAAQATFQLTATPQLFNQYANLNNSQTIVGDWSAPSPAGPNSIVPKNYVDGKIFGGIGNASESATGTVQIATGVQMASSTTSGTLGRLVIPSSLSTSTFNSQTASLRTVVTQNSGKIDNNFIATTTLFSNINITGTTTIAQPQSFINNTGDQVLWTLLATSSLSAPAVSMSVDLPAPGHKLLRIYVFSAGNSQFAGALRFNGDGGNNYAYSIGSTVNTSLIRLSSDTTLPYASTIDVISNASTTKRVMITTITGGSVGSAPTFVTNAGIWIASTTGSVSNVTLISSDAGTNMSASTSMWIYGSAF